MNCGVAGIISVIVPVYKTEAFLPRCIDSILNQTYTNLEVILVDDGSPDGSGVICDQYAQKDSRVRVIHQENQGVSAARNAGLDAANGEYISFIDSDDWIEPCTYQEVIADIEQHQVDGVFFGLNMVDEYDNIIEVWSPKQTGVVDNMSALRHMYGMVEIPSYGSGGCNKLFRKSALTKYRFNQNLCSGEDSLFFAEVVASCHRVFMNRNTYYQYLQHTGSAMHQQGLSKQRIDALRAWLRIAEVVKSNCWQLCRKARATVFRSGIFMLIQAYMSENGMQQEMQELIATCWKDYLIDGKGLSVGRLKYVLIYGMIRMHASKQLVSFVLNLRRECIEGGE